MVSTCPTRPGPSTPSRGQRLALGRGWGWGDPSRGLGLHVLCRIETSGTGSALFTGRVLHRHAPPSSPNWTARRWILTGGHTVSEFLQINLSGRAVLTEWDTHPPPPQSKFSCSFCELRPFLGFWRPLWMQLKSAARFSKSTDCLSCFPKRYKNKKCLYQTNRKCIQYYSFLFKVLPILCPIIKVY